MSLIDRRRFLGNGALAAAGIVGAASTAAAQRKRLRFIRQAPSAQPTGPNEPTSGPIRLSLKFGMVQGSQSMLEKFKMLKEIGFDGVELDSPNNYDRKEVLRARDESGLVIDGLIDSVHWSKPLSDPDPNVQREGIEGLKRAIEDAKAYGATTVLLVPAVVTERVSYREAWERSQANIRKALPFAAERQIGIALENVWNKFLLSPLEFARYIDELASPWVGAQFDIGNVIEFGYPQEWIRVLGKRRIFKLDVKEYGRARRFDYKLGEGEINWGAVRDALKEIDFHGYAAAEIPGGDREYLADVVARMKRILGRENA